MRLCLCLPFQSLTEALACAELSEAIALVPSLLLEMRAERFGASGPEAVHALAQRFGARRLVVACRGPSQLPPAEQGAGEALQGAVYRAAQAAGVHAVDVDGDRFAADPALRAQLRRVSEVHAAMVVASLHFYGPAPAPSALQRTWRRLAVLGADVCKIALPASPLARSLRLWGEFREAVEPCPLLLVPMGLAGVWARVLAGARRQPAPWAYVRMAGEAGTAPGQLDWRTAREVYRCEEVQCDEPAYGLVGHPLGHSLSPLLHNRLLRNKERRGRYVPFDCPTAADARALLRLGPATLRLRGLSVTLPYKVLAAGAAATSSDAVVHTGAANTLVWHDGGWQADNTDVFGLARSLASIRQPIAGRSPRILLLGAGGVSRAACAAVLQGGGTPVIWARRAARGRELARGSGGVFVEALADGLAAADGVVQCTPVGMVPNEDACLLSDKLLAKLPPHAYVLDTIYRPEQTLLVRRARARGLVAAGGTELFVQQAAHQCFRLYGIRPTSSTLRQWMQRPSHGSTAGTHADASQ